MSVPVRLDRLPQNWREQPELFRRYWDQTMKRIEGILNDILSIPEIEQALTDVEAATVAAQEAADNANEAAGDITTEQALVVSFPTGFTPPLVEADSTGDVVIVNHDRQYGDAGQTTVAVTGDTISTGGGAGDVIRVYYDDASRAGGAVTYAFTVDPADPPVQGGDRHVVGAVTIPGAGSQAGNPVRPPGFVEP